MIDYQGYQKKLIIPAQRTAFTAEALEAYHYGATIGIAAGC